MAVYDETWKEAMNQWFEPFVAFFFPHVHRDIEWSRGWESLNKELQQVVRDAAFGVKRADKLVKVWRRNGEQAWLLIHLEFQSQREAEFERRITLAGCSNGFWYSRESITVKSYDFCVGFRNRARCRCYTRLPPRYILSRKKPFDPCPSPC
jgi:hypothetical protein